MYTAQIENMLGDILTLTQKESDYQILSITGLNPPNAQINTTTMYGMDGAKFNSSKLNTRNIVITIRINGDVEGNRQQLYEYFPTKEWVKFYYQNNNRNVFIEGYVENLECDFFTNSEQAQISIICPQPYFKAMDEIIDDASKVTSVFVFPFSFGSKGATDIDITPDASTDDAIPFSTIEQDLELDIYNGSSVETGMTITVTFYGSVNQIKIVNTGTGEYMTINYAFLSGDVLTINTNKGQKGITLQRDATTTNIFGSLVQGSTFFQLIPKDNFFSYLADNGTNDTLVHVVFYHNTLYRGV